MKNENNIFEDIGKDLESVVEETIEDIKVIAEKAKEMTEKAVETIS